MTKSSNPLRNTSFDSQTALTLIEATMLFRKEARSILSHYESSTARIITLEESYAKLANLSLKQDDLLIQALRCIENNVFRAGYVLAWAALMDFLEEKIATNFPLLRQLRPKWPVKTIDDLRDVGSDYQIIELTRQAGYCTKTEDKALKGLLNRRNESAHPTDYDPQLNEALGFISEILQRLQKLQTRWVKQHS